MGLDERLLGGAPFGKREHHHREQLRECDELRPTILVGSETLLTEE
jgi:hypothetical protein